MATVKELVLHHIRRDKVKLDLVDGEEDGLAAFTDLDLGMTHVVVVGSD